MQVHGKYDLHTMCAQYAKEVASIIDKVSRCGSPLTAACHVKGLSCKDDAALAVMYLLIHNLTFK